MTEGRTLFGQCNNKKQWEVSRLKIQQIENAKTKNKKKKNKKKSLVFSPWLHAMFKMNQ